MSSSSSGLSNWFYDEDNDFLPYDVDSLTSKNNQNKINASVFKFISERKKEYEFKRYEVTVRKEIINKFLERTIRDITRHNEYGVEEQWARVMILDELKDFQFPPFSDEEKIEEWFTDIGHLQGKARVAHTILKNEHKFNCGIAKKYFPIHINEKEFESISGENSNEPLNSKDILKYHRRYKDHKRSGNQINENEDVSSDNEEKYEGRGDNTYDEDNRGYALHYFLYVDWFYEKPLSNKSSQKEKGKRKRK